MDGDWIKQELRTANLNDKRLNKRFAEVLRSLSKHPQVSIPTACGGHAETMAAYRFFENEKTTLENILQPHRHATEERVASQDVVLCVQDTTELDLTRPERQIRGTGPIGTSTVRRGAYLHLPEVFTPDGPPLGTLWNKVIVRKDETTEEKAIKKKNRPAMPIEEKESFRWLEGHRQTIRLAECNKNTTCICISDSESDIFEVFAEPRVANAHLIIRAFRERNVTDADGEETHFLKAVHAGPVLAKFCLTNRSGSRRIG